MGFEAEIWAWRWGEGKEEEEEEEKIPLCESIGHRSLRGRCPAPSFNYNHDLPKQGTGTADHLTLLRLFFFLFYFFPFLPFPDVQFLVFSFYHGMKNKKLG